MANKKKLQKAVIKFRKENPERHLFYSRLIRHMAKFIKVSGAPEVTVGITRYGAFYNYANS